MDAADVLGGRYRLVERLGEGGMSVVWRAHDEVLGRQVAVKLLSARFVADHASRQRIRAEAQAVARLSHPNIAGVFDYGESQEDVDGVGERVPYIVMELLNGSTLAEVLESGPLPIPRVLRICSEVANALGAAHEQDIVHRDVKPANVMITATGAAKVVDFGVAAMIGDLTEQDAVLFGTPAYVAPERLEGGAVVTGTDVYGLGVLLYRMLTGYMPWSADSTTQMLIAHMYVEPDPLPPLSGLPPEVVEICQACLAKDPGDRPEAAEVAEVLAAAAGVLSGAEGAGVPRVAVRRPVAKRARPVGGRVVARPGAAATTARRVRYLAVAGAVAAVVAAAVVATALVNPGGNPADGSSPFTSGDEAPIAQPATSAGVGGVGPGGSPGAQPGRSGEPGVPDGDPRRPVSPPVVTTSTTGPGGEPKIDPVTSQPLPVTSSAEAYGNTVRVQCVGTMATILDFSAAEGWSMTRITRGPAEQVNIRFESATIAPNRTGFKSRCPGGVPRINPDAS